MNFKSIREIILNFFILSLLSFFGYLVAREFFPLVYPGAAEKLFWLSLVSGTVSFILYSPSVYLPIQRILHKCKFRHSGAKFAFAHRTAKILGSETENAARVRLNWVFQAFLLSFLIIILIMQYSGFDLINTTYLLIAVVFFGILSFFYPPGEDVFKVNRTTKADYYLAVFLGIVGTILVWYKIQDLGTIGYFISIVSGILIILLSIFIIEEE